jgi:hypothetical protein
VNGKPVSGVNCFVNSELVLLAGGPPKGNGGTLAFSLGSDLRDMAGSCIIPGVCAGGRVGNDWLIVVAAESLL